ncbi:MAG: iron-sulfur cluster assembly scaffold protein [Candidatus Woesearchaeota archaeon]|jgi:nitrogen fixation NifU-like protein|nr:iron-sulfur cluster assembly scaffold protein [Candidatus Woesearchaeota archaeon]MDP7506696.1 iron-sulfur cluster assembly scaffold protein [Candidatus Woesearchaeota archaeon]
MYSKKVMKIFKNPKHIGELKNADGIGKVGNPTCGDVMEISIKVKNKAGKEIVEDIKVKTFGCVAAISSSDILCDMVKGKTIEEVSEITKDDVVKELGKLPPNKIHCSLLAVDALKRAVENYKKKKKV